MLKYKLCTLKLLVGFFFSKKTALSLELRDKLIFKKFYEILWCQAFTLDKTFKSIKKFLKLPP